MDSRDLTVLSTERIFPDTYRTHDRSKIVNLSILDASAAYFSDCAAIWYIDVLDEKQPATVLSAKHLKSTLQIALRGYDHFCGRLHIAPSAGPEDFDGRVQVTVNKDAQDPGVELRVCSDPRTISQLVLDRASDNWSPLLQHSTAASQIFLSPTKLVDPLSEDPADPSPSTTIQATHLACGGLVLSVRIAHVLADAQTLTQLMGDWARVSRETLNTTAPPDPGSAPQPPTGPVSLTSAIPGSTAKGAASPAILAAAYRLPVHRFDWWASRTDHATTTSLAPSAARIPWAQWDMAAPVASAVVRLSRMQIDALWREAASTTSTPDDAARVSRQDAVVGHVWSRITRARAPADAAAPTHCAVTFNLRGRVAPAPAPRATGSFTMLAHAALPARAVARSGAAAAAAVRGALGAVSGAESVGALLHALHHEAAPQRIWQACLGARHVLVTSWVRAGAVAAGAFGAGRVRRVEPVMQALDGLVCVVEAAPEEGVGEGVEGRHWADDGVDVYVSLEAAAMAELLGDPGLLPVVS